MLYAIPLVSQVWLSAVWQHRLARWAPVNAGLAIQATSNVAKLPIGPWPGLGVLGLWTAAALAGGWTVLRLRDA
jgi:ABC-2 type transport system permease protein